MRQTTLSLCRLTVTFLLALTSAAYAQLVTVDNEGAGFTLLAGSWNTGAFGTPNGTNYNWADTVTGTATHRCEWRPTLPSAGSYEVAVWYVPGGNRSNNAPFRIYHSGGTTLVNVNQQVNGQTWFSLGTYTFAAGTSGYVTLDNSANASVVIADAVRFTKVNSTVQIGLASSPPAWGSTTPAAGVYTYGTGSTVNITATAQPGYEFYGWTVSNGAAPADPSAATTTVLADENKWVTAVFIEEGFVEYEFRGFWADAFAGGFKSTTQINDMVARAVAGGYNAILPEIMAYQDTGGSGHGAYWNSAILPRASDISGSFDPLAYLVTQAHAAGLEVHPWLVAFRTCSTWPPAGNPTLQAHPEWLMVPSGNMGGGPAKVGGYYVLDPGSPDAQDYLLAIVSEIVNNYDVDGLHWDYIRYTQSDAGYPASNSYQNSGLKRFQAITGYAGTPSTTYDPWDDFRRRTITEVVRRAQVIMATADNPRQPLRHSAALITWGNAPTSFTSTSAYGVFQYWEQWLDKGYLDAGIPMTYYDDSTYPTYFRNWVDRSIGWKHQRHLFVGPGIYLNDYTESQTQITYARNAGADGICTYSYAATGTGGDWSWYTSIAPSLFDFPAVPPPMTWRDPATATEGYLHGYVVDGGTGLPVDNANVTVAGVGTVQTDGNGFFVVTHIPAGAVGTTYAVQASRTGLPSATRPYVLLERAGYTQANFALGPWLPGDYDVDRDVDATDAAAFFNCFTGPDAGAIGAGCDLFDFDADADLDLQDFSLMQTAIGG